MCIVSKIFKYFINEKLYIYINWSCYEIWGRLHSSLALENAERLCGVKVGHILTKHNIDKYYPWPTCTKEHVRMKMYLIQFVFINFLTSSRLFMRKPSECCSIIPVGRQSFHRRSCDMCGFILNQIFLSLYGIPARFSSKSKRWSISMTYPWNTKNIGTSKLLQWLVSSSFPSEIS